MGLLCPFYGVSLRLAIGIRGEGVESERVEFTSYFYGLVGVKSAGGQDG